MIDCDYVVDIYSVKVQKMKLVSDWIIAEFLNGARPENSIMILVMTAPLNLVYPLKLLGNRLLGSKTSTVMKGYYGICGQSQDTRKERKHSAAPTYFIF